MPSRTIPVLASLVLAVALAPLASAPPAAAQGFHGGGREGIHGGGHGGYRGGGPYGPAYASAYDGAYGNPYGGAYGFAGEFVRGDYIGAPLTQVPSTLKLVPTPWSYGTYGVPTVSGIPQAPVAQPTLTRINARGSGADPAAGVRVIDVQVPRR